MQKIIYILCVVSMFLTQGCSDQSLEKQAQQLQASNDTLQKKVTELTKLHDEFDNAASLYQGCVSLNGFLSNLCPKQVLIEGKIAEDKGYPGGGWLYWSTLAGKIIIFIIFFFLSFFLSWFLYIKIIEPKLNKIEAANDKIKNADNLARKSQAEMQAAEAKKKQYQNDIAEAVEQLSMLREEIEDLNQEIERKKQDMDLLSGFD